MKFTFTKISPVWDWRSTLHSWCFCQVQSHVTQILGQISKIWPDKFRYCALVWESVVSCQLLLQMAEEIAVENGRISNFQGLVTFTLTLDRVILHTSCITDQPLPTCQISLKSKKLFVDGRTCVHTYMDWRTFETGRIRSTLKSRPT